MSRDGTEEPPLPIPEEGAFFIIDKPRGPSSHQVTAWVRDMLGVPKAGHAGTLDPGVSGILVIAVGKALPLIPLVLTFPKRYIAVFEFHGPVESAGLQRYLHEFEGEIYQTPPVRSAVRRDRRVRRIHSLKLLELRESAALVEVNCESGTYVRTLAVDLGDALGTGAHMAELRRISTGPFDERAVIPLTVLADAVTLAREGDPAPLKAVMHSPFEIWGAVPTVIIKDTAVDALAHGADLAAQGVSGSTGTFIPGQRVAIVSRKRELVAVGKALIGSLALAKTKKGLVVDAERVFMSPGKYPSSWGSGKHSRKDEEPASP